MKVLAVATAGIACLMAGFPGPRSACASVPLEKSGWLVYWDLEGGEKTIQDLNGGLDGISLFACHFNSKGHLIPASDALPGQLRAWKTRQISGRPFLWLTAVNDKVDKETSLYKDPAVVHQVLSDPAKRQAHLQELLDLSKGADGLEIDYENLLPADRGEYSHFLSELGTLLHARGQRLSVVVEPRTETQEKVEGPGAADWAEIAVAADRVRVMAYYLHYGGGVSGPTAPPEWLDHIVAFALQRIPSEKLDIALCLDGIDWASDARGSECSFDQIEKLRTEKQIPLLRSDHGEPPHFTYQQGKDVHQVWYEDSESLREKMDRIQKAGVMHVSFWRLGTGDPDFWNWLAGQNGMLKPKK